MRSVYVKKQCLNISGRLFIHCLWFHIPMKFELIFII